MKRHVLLAVGFIGLIELIAPKVVVRIVTQLAYRDAEAAKPREWIHTAVRMEGALLVVTALVGLYRIAGGTSRVERRESEDT